MITVAEAREKVLALARVLPPETVALRAAAGRVLAGDVVAARDQPPFAASAMDGYAIREADHRTGARLRVTGMAAAGHAFAGGVGPGEAVRIFTGAPMPEGAERVVLQEDVERDGETAVLGPRIEAGTNVRPRGQDFRAGDRLAAPRRLTAKDLSLIAAMNVGEVSVARRPVLAVVMTGDELVMPGEAPRDDQIIASNGFAIAALAEAAGAEVRLLPIAKDTPESLGFALELAAGADVIVTIGGASVGDHDLVGRVAGGMGLDRAFWKIAMRPGKPLMAGRLGGSVLLGLPGNPVSAIICARLFLIPLAEAMQGLPGAAPATFEAELAEAVEANGPREHYMRARLEAREGRAPLIRAFARQDSALLADLSEADALILRPIGDPARAAGERVAYLPL